PFERLVDELKVERNLSHTPLFQVALTLQNLPDSDLDLAGLRVSPLDFAAGRTHFDLSLFLVPLPGDAGLAAHLYAASELFDPATTRRLLGHYRNLLASAVGGGDDRPLSEIPLMSPEELAQVVGEWNDTATPFPSAATIDALFAAQARLHPEAVAVLSGSATLTYAELDRRSDRIAARLRAAGVRPDDAVGLCAARSPNLVAALLGILKAGGG